MRTHTYILDENHGIKMEPSFIEWGKWFATHSRTVNRDMYFDNDIVVTVSTVFLGIDHSAGTSRTPILFETMVFDGEHDGYRVRYHTWEEAETGHRKVCEMIEHNIK
jgi:hypothetical protein